MSNDEIIKKRLHDNMKLYKMFHTKVIRLNEDGEFHKDFLFFNPDIFPDNMQMYRKLEKEISDDIAKYLKIYKY